MAYLGLPQEKSALPSPEFPTETTPSYEITPEQGAELQNLQVERQQQQEARSLVVEPTDYTKLSGQQNRGIAKGVQMVVGDSAELYSVPATTKEDLFARGFLDNSGEPTSKGRLAVTLIKKGVLNPDFTLSENGRLFNKKEGDFFTQDNAESQSTYQSYFEADPDRYNKMLEWKKAKELGLFDEESDMAKEKSFSDTAVEKGKGLLGMVSNAGKMLQAAARVAVGSELPFMDVAGLESPEVEAKIRTRIAGGEEGFVEMAGQSFMNQSAWINKGVNAVLEKTGVLTKEQADAQNTFNEYKAASFKDFYKKTDTVAELSSAIGLDDAANQLAASEQLLGKEQFGKIKAEGAEVGAFLGDITNIEISPLMKAFGMVAGGGSKLLNSVVNANRIKEVKKITALTAESSLYEARTAEAASKVQLFTGEAGRANELKRFATTAGDTEQAIAHSVNEASWARQAAEATAQAERNAAMSQTLREAANGLENTLPPTFQSQIINAGKLPVALPLKAVGFAAKKFGDTLASVDRGASSFLETFGLDKYRGLARAASIFTGNVNPLSIAEGVVASNKLWNGAGRLLDSVGENMLVNQGTVPFFRRVADDMATPWGKTFATQLDNFVPPVARGVGAISKGIAGAAAPSLIYEAINHQGLDANVFKQSATDALVFGGTHGVFKAAMVGKSSDFNAVKAGDRANFNERLKTADPEQYDIYNSKVDPSTKDLISSFSGAYPNAKIKFVTEGPSYQSGNTATFNVNAPREHSGVIALHELKHVLQNEFQLDEAILAHMVGNKTRGGEIFTKDGSLDPEFVKFSNEYNNRIKALGQPELGVHDLAIEFYTDKAAEVLKSDIKSGEFTKRAQESQLSRTVKSHFSSLVNQVPIIKNIHIKTGGAIDSSGRLVKGSGLLSEGFTQSKDVQAMVRKLYRETAGVSKPVVSVAQEGAAMRQPRATKSTREGINNGTSAIEKVNRESRAAGLEVPEGALDPSTVRGRDGVPTELQTKAIIDSGAIHPDHLGTFPMLVGEMNPSSTSTFLFHYRPAEQGRTTQSAAGETFHHIKPVGVRTNKKGNVLITALDVNLWDQNIKKVANSKPAKDLGYTEKQIRADSYEASKYHIKNQSPDAYFEQKYGKAQALKRKSLVASTYGEMTAKQRAYNPLLSEVGMGRPDHVYRTFSLDDVKSATRTNSSVNLSFDPNNYYSLKVNLMPEAPIVDRSGNIIENPAMKDFFENHLPNGQRFRENSMPESKILQGTPTRTMPESSARYMPEKVDADYMKAVKAGDIKTQQRMVDEAAKRAGYTIRGYHGTRAPEKFTEFIPNEALGGAIFVATNPAEAKVFGRVMNVFVKAKNVRKGIVRSYDEVRAIAAAKKRGQDAIRVTDAWDAPVNYAVFNSSQVKLAEPIVYDNSGQIIPLSKRFDLKSEDIRYMPEQTRQMPEKVDADYMKVVESGDVKAQERAVDEAAKAAGYEKRWNFSEDIGIDANRGAFYTTSSKAAADSWGEGRIGQTRPVFISAKAKAIEGKNILSSSFMTPEMVTKLKSAGFDSASGGRDWKRGDEIAVFSPEQIKSADPITRDDFGNIIPPSKRFDITSKDLRYMPEGQAKPSYLPETSIKSQMDKMLENKPEIPKDLQKAWDIGYKTKDLSDSDAVNSGQVPDWVFNFGNDVNEFYEAGRRGETPEYVVGWRKGKIPESGRSKNYADSSLESGVSLAYAHNRTDMETSPMTMIGVSNRKKTYVSGWAFPKSKWGSDGEIVIVGANEFKPIKKSKSTVKVKTSPESISSVAKMK